jgi:5-methylcytosine-specific restriction endonuclease McrA
MSNKVLLLSKSYQPVAFCDVKRAIVLILLEKAEAIEVREGQSVRGVSRNFICPSIIRLKNNDRSIIKVPLNRKNILKRDGFKCVYCGGTSDLTIDHIVPKCRGGKSSWENLVSACTKCNNKKDDKLPHEIGMSLKTDRKSVV